MSLLVSGSHICAPERDPNIASPYKTFINLGKTFFRIFHIWNIGAQTWLLAGLFVYLTSFISQILGSLLRAFSLTWPASMQIYWSRKKHLHKKRVQFPHNWLGHQHGCRFIVLGHRYGRHDIIFIFDGVSVKRTEQENNFLSFLLLPLETH